MVVFILVVFKIFLNHQKFKETNFMFDHFAAIQQKMIELKISRIKFCRKFRFCFVRQRLSA